MSLWLTRKQLVTRLTRNDVPETYEKLVGMWLTREGNRVSYDSMVGTRLTKYDVPETYEKSVGTWLTMYMDVAS